ncbi:MAG: argininosuccinate synthase [Actinomycetota bacterium]
MTDRVVLAYSGGLDTSVAALRLREEQGLDVVACLVDLGQPFDVEAVRARAEAAHADLHVIDARHAFAEEFCLPALHANALYEGKYPLVSALARPLIAAEVVRVARERDARFVAHGCTGKGNDQVRFETSFAALAPELGVLAPVRESAMSRDEALGRAHEAGIPISTEARTYSVDENLWGRTVECGPLEDPWVEPPADAFVVTVDPRSAPDEPLEAIVAFENGRPVALDGKASGLPELVAALTEIGGAHGFGRVDMIENRLVGIKSREVYEVPGALALVAAHRDLEDLTLERDMAHEKAALERRWAELCYFGQWYGPLHAGLRAFMERTQERVTGEVRIRFHKGSCTVVGRRSPNALYDLSLATYDESGDRFDHRLAEGFVSLWSLPIRVWAEVGKPGGGHADGVGAAPARGALRSFAALRASDAQTPRSGAAPPLSPEGRLGSRPVWHARFGSAPADAANMFTRDRTDRRLIVQDLVVTRAHVKGLRGAGLLAAEELDSLVGEIDGLLGEAREGAFPFSDEDEDVHVAVERVLTERLGSLGAKVHAGRSRNDLVVTDLRLWVRAAATELASGARELAEAFGERAEEHAETVVPGYTHLQRAQPVTLGQHLLAHAFPLVRDADRLDRAAEAASVSSLGAAALAGSTLGVDAAFVADELGLVGTFDNSMDAVADRDFALEFLSACLSLAVHLSRIGEDVVLWSSEEFGFARPDDGYATGSSIMPQKRNPDVAELARAQAGRVLGDLVALATVLKGLPLTYNRDLQQDKPPVFDAFDALAPALDAMTGMIRTLWFDAARMRAAADGFLLATDLAEHLARQGTPFREAHERVAKVVAALEADGRSFSDVPPEEWPPLDPGLGPDVAALLTPEAAVARRATAGGPAPASVRRQVDVLRARLR